MHRPLQDLREYRYVGLKSTQHFRGFFGTAACRIIPTDPPGLNSGDLSVFEFKKRNIKPSNSEGVIVKGIDSIKVELSQCCCPIPGDPIIGYISRGKGVKVHRCNCPTLKTLQSRFIDVEWDESVINNVLHQVDLIIRASDRNNLLVEIMNTLSTLKITPLELNAVSHKENLNASVHLSIMVKDGEHYQSVENSLKNIKGVFDVERTARN